MNFSSMDYFVMVARERSFSRAAERLHITQQTLSAHIAKLEGELGTKLLVRNIPLELTYAGRCFWGTPWTCSGSWGPWSGSFRT